ncbi:hypothetical protein [Fusobacterium sp.]|uniref:toxin-antitoxin system YwqK family antitoxin n=1 Tax=Fusobacterium sp. TaxID=68766 RepID=UPI00260246AD|nr:hypothetical protein [Fusobacterium sp.]
MKKLLSIFFLLMLLVSCGEKPSYLVTDDDDFSYYDLSRTDIESDFSIIKPIGISKFKDDDLYYQLYGDGEPFSGEGVYYYSDSIVSESEFENGQYKRYTEFYMNGRLRILANFKNGKLNGDQREYYSTGKVKRKSTRKDGKLDGKEIAYYSNGRVLRKVNYKDGKLDGECRFYEKSGALKAKEIYSNGELISSEK